MVYGLLKTSTAVSVIAPGYVATSLIGFTGIYSLLAVVEIGLMVRLAKVPEPVLADTEALSIPELIY